MQKEISPKKGFTIIELLVAIVVIGILASIMIVSYTGIQQRSRDSERTSHTTQIKLALEKYRADKSMYPDPCTPAGSACSATLLLTELSPYLSSIPLDPRYGDNVTNGYRYIRSAVTLDGYALRVAYEAKPVCKTGQNIVAAWWGSIPNC